jgi:hypothetical protein
MIKFKGGTDLAWEDANPTSDLFWTPDHLIETLDRKAPAVGLYPSEYSIVAPPEHANIHGNMHDNELRGGRGDDTITGRGGRDTIYGGNGDDHLFGGTGNDLLFGNPGHDHLHGGSGNDGYVVRAGDNDVISETRGNGEDAGGFDRVVAYTSFTLGAFIEDLRLYGAAVDGTGNAGDNRIFGNGHAHLSGMAGDDLLSGIYGNDVLDGGVGDDKLVGAVGHPTMTGGEGQDRFVEEPLGGSATITDFSTTDDLFVFSRSSWHLPRHASVDDYVVINKDSDDMPTRPQSDHGYVLASDNAVWFEYGVSSSEPIKVFDYNRSDGSLTLDSFAFTR